MSEICPRCEQQNPQKVHEGHEQGKRVWTVWHCTHCAFSWRDSEAAEVIDPRQRPAWAQLKGVNLDGLRHLIEPQKQGSKS